MLLLDPRLRGGERFWFGTMTEKTLRPITVITGASSGIGVELARVFARAGHQLALVARREDRLRALADEIAATSKRRPIVIAADLADASTTQKIADELRAHGAEPQYMVNNAGFGLVGLADLRERDDELAMIDVNVRALTDLSLAFADSLARHRGGILNVGSMAGFLPGPGMAVYYATKSYVLSFSEALYAEFKPKGVRVTVVCPGPVPTEFAEIARPEKAARVRRPAGAERSASGGGRLPRADARAPRGGAGLPQQGRRLHHPAGAAPVLAAGGRQPAEPAQGRAGHIAAIHS